MAAVDRIPIIRALRLAIIAILVLMPLTAGVVLVIAADRVVLPLILVGITAFSVYLILRGPIIIRTQSGRE